MAVRLMLLIATLLFALMPARPAAAAPSTHVKIVVDSIGGQPRAGRPELWSGTVLRDGPRAPEIPECVAVSCERIAVTVDLPGLLWRVRSGGVQIAIRFINGTPDDNLALAVYRNGHRIAASTAQVGTAQSVVIPEAANGLYQVYVVDGVAFGNPGPTPSIAYEGLAQVVYDSIEHPIRDLLPDLVALPQQNVTFGPPFDIFNDPVPPGSTCHQSEIDEDHAHTCLRFDQVLGNIGKGALDIRFSQPSGVPPVDDQEVPTSQRIYRSDGTFSDVPAGNVHWHAIHQHYHFDGFAQSNLWRTSARGRRAGAAPIATGNKVSFCIATTNIDAAFEAEVAFPSEVDVRRPAQRRQPETDRTDGQPGRSEVTRGQHTAIHGVLDSSPSSVGMSSDTVG